MDVQEIREDFPILKDVIYLDSASTSLTPEPVLEVVLDYYRSYKANVGRGVYQMAQLADQHYRDAHRKVADFVGGGGSEGMTVFTRNTTESINIVARGMLWKKGDRIVTTLTEHHSNLLPWMRLKEKGVELQVIKPDKTGMLDLADYEKAITKGTRLVAASQLSNALGTVLPVKEISKICRERGAALLVDGAQSVPHMPVDVKDIDCDFLCFSGHKMLAPMGTGVLWIKKEGEVEPLLVGGGMVQDVGDLHEGGYEIKKGYDVANSVKTWSMRTRSDQLESLTLEASGTFSRAEKLWLQDGGTYHNLLSGPYTFSNANSNIRNFTLFWGNMQPRATVSTMPNKVVQGGTMISFNWSYNYPFLIDHIKLSLQNDTDSLLVNDYLNNTQSAYAFLLADFGYAGSQAGDRCSGSGRDRHTFHVRLHSGPGSLYESGHD